MARYRFGAVIPAAGLSSRMGAFKPLLPFGGATVIESSVGSAMQFADEMAVVLGFRSDELEPLLRGRFGGRLTLVRNPDYAATDMLRSIQLGLRALGECDAFFLLPADMPAVPACVYRTLIAAFDPDCGVVYPYADGRRGHPPLISARLIPSILSYEGEGGLRAVLGGADTKYVPVSGGGIFLDLDTPEDYAKQTRENSK